MNSLLTTSQTAGPFFHDCLLRPDATRNVLTEAETLGERIRIQGRVLDGDGAGVPDASIEIWQANAAGRYNHPADMRAIPLDPAFIGFGRSGTDADGMFWFETIKPGRVPFQSEFQAPHICLTIFARGLLNHLPTRLYFADEASNAQDAVLQRVPPERRATLLAQPISQNRNRVYHLDIRLQGADETVFFNF